MIRRLPVIEQLQRDFPACAIRILFHSRGNASNDKVAKLHHLVTEARYEHLVINDSDVRVAPDYMRTRDRASRPAYGRGRDLPLRFRRGTQRR